MTNILIVEDNVKESNLYKNILELYGYKTYQCFDGDEAIKQISKENYDLFIVDIMMPIMDGYDFVKEAKIYSRGTPILMISANQMVENRLKGFELGIDDFLIKPFNNEEFLYRIKALLRRYSIGENGIIKFSNTVLDNNKKIFKFKNKIIHLTNREFNLLFKLLSNPGNVYTKELLLEDVWDDQNDISSNVLESHISKLKNKVSMDDDFKIINIRNIGYVAEVENENKI